MITRSPLLMAFAALVLTACAMAMGSTGPAGTSARAAPVQGTAQAFPFTCALTTRQQGGAVALEGRLEATEAVSATYALRVRGPGVSIDQSGDLSMKAGTDAVVGEASVNGGMVGLEASMTVTSEGRTVACPVRPG
ncbi:curli-like amyloid fiber formation chaperone CsgH [Rubellimicrobium arenae]|uniref:curli-like amyloid fiber formation chaperone CsgH n=1 Tax=Rubellimicrobium arenae TaxID=2817372 RepID=UPI001B30EC32|nr:curli-like amyloid fiber formation chaperone CsgH [Rubellimicrobium arenae]